MGCPKNLSDNVRCREKKNAQSISISLHRVQNRSQNLQQIYLLSAVLGLMHLGYGNSESRHVLLRAFCSKLSNCYGRPLFEPCTRRRIVWRHFVHNLRFCVAVGVCGMNEHCFNMFCRFLKLSGLNLNHPVYLKGATLQFIQYLRFPRDRKR